MSEELAEQHYHGHRERLRTRLRDAGADALADYELLELILFRAIPRRDVKPLAKALIGKAKGAVVEDILVEENGRFTWSTDPEGNRFELWEPAPSA